MFRNEVGSQVVMIRVWGLDEWVELFLCCALRSSLSLVHSNDFLNSVVRRDRNKQNQLQEQGHPTTSQGDDITVSSCPVKTKRSNNQGKGQVILTAG